MKHGLKDNAMPITDQKTEQSAHCCGVCGGNSRVLDSRREPRRLYRRRQCLRCENRWSTLELSFDQLTALNENALVLRELTELLQSRLGSLKFKYIDNLLRRDPDHET